MRKNIAFREENRINKNVNIFCEIIGRGTTRKKQQQKKNMEKHVKFMKYSLKRVIYTHFL